MERKIWFAISIAVCCMLLWLLWEAGVDKALIAINAFVGILNATLQYFLDD